MGGTPESSRSRIAVLKVVYLLTVTAGAFGVPALDATRPSRWYVVPALLLTQVVVLVACRVAWGEVLRPAARLKWLFLFLVACYTLLPGDSRSSEDVFYYWHLTWVGRELPLNLTGLEQAGLMCLQILTLISASAVVRLTGPGTDLVDGLRAFRLPLLFVCALDQTLALLGGQMRSTGGRGRKLRDGEGATAARPPGLFVMLGRLLRGDIGFFARSIEGNLARAGDQVRGEYEGRLDAGLARDVAVIAGVSLCMVSLKMLKVLPGIPFAAGHKTLLLFPLYTLASQLTRSRWGGTAAGSIMGVIGFLQGDGRFGALEMLKHVAPGLVIDLARPLVRRLPRSAWVFCFLGLVAGVARTTTELVVVLLLGGRAEVYIFPAAKLVPNLLAGTLSGFVTLALLRAFAGVVPTTGSAGDDRPDEARLAGLLSEGHKSNVTDKRTSDV